MTQVSRHVVLATYMECDETLHKQKLELELAFWKELYTSSRDNFNAAMAELAKGKSVRLCLGRDTVDVAQVKNG